jgi:hypothetical protein
VHVLARTVVIDRVHSSSFVNFGTLMAIEIAHEIDSLAELHHSHVSFLTKTLASLAIASYCVATMTN